MYLLDFKDVRTNVRVDKNKIDSCSFNKIIPGDYILINFCDSGVHDEDGWSGGGDLGTLFVKVVSVKLPQKASFFSNEFFGQVMIELPNGKITELMKPDMEWVNREIHTYFMEKCFPEIKRPACIRHGLFVYNSGDPELQKLMRKESARRERRKAEL